MVQETGTGRILPPRSKGQGEVPVGEKSDEKRTHPKKLGEGGNRGYGRGCKRGGEWNPMSGGRHIKGGGTPGQKAQRTGSTKKWPHQKGRKKGGAGEKNAKNLKPAQTAAGKKTGGVGCKKGESGKKRQRGAMG